MRKNISRKTLSVVLSLVLVLCMTVTAHAVTPSFEVPDMPDIPKIKIEFPDDFLDDFWDKWFKEHPVPEIKIELDAPTISTAKYVHSSSRYNPSRLEIYWNKVDNAESYEVLITKADGTTISYNTTNNMIYDTKIGCMRIYIEDTSTWASATVTVRAVWGAITSEWSEPVKIGCNKLHVF